MVNPRAFALSELPTHHEEYVHDVAFDFYGKRVATCSSDKKIKIWHTDDQGRWQLTPTYEWRKHTGSIWKLAWSHPVFGALLASAAADKLVYVWEEPSAGGRDKPATEWRPVCTLVDHRAEVVDVAFGPRQFGLRLATACLDGHLRVYEGNDSAVGDRWDLVDDFEPGHPPRREGQAGTRREGSDPTIPVTCLSWNPSPFDRVQSLAVGCADGSVRVWSYSEPTRRWEVTCDLKPHEGEVHAVSWAPSMGRCGHLIASCGAGPKGAVFVTRLKAQASELAFMLLQEMVLCVEGDRKEVWKVCWNITGTTLASSGDDGVVRLWKRNLAGDWESTEVQQAYGPLPEMF
jgi:nucleoporin SEH1